MNFEKFKNIILPNENYISYEDFVENTSLNKTWELISLKKDIRFEKFKTKKVFLDFYYKNFIEDSSKFLEVFYDQRIHYDLDSVNFDLGTKLLEVRNGKILNRPKLTRYLRSVMIEPMLKCKNRYGIGLKDIIQDIFYKGKFIDSFTVPSVVKDFNVKDFITPESLIITLRTKAGFPSVYSPLVYKSLLLYMKRHGNYERLLCPTASWGTPVIAANDIGLKELSIVDVQCDVLSLCYNIHKDITDKNSIFVDDYVLNTHCISSEYMSQRMELNSYDMIFFCPPYFDLEEYDVDDPEQSTEKYKSYETWLNGYWKLTVEESHKLLKSDSVFSFTINDYADDKWLLDDMVKIAQTNFEYVEKIQIQSLDKNAEDINKNPRSEYCVVMKKRG